MNIPNLSRAASLIVAHQRAEQEAHAEVDAFHAPSECHGLVSKGEARRTRAMRRHVEGVTGFHFHLVTREIRRRLSPACAYRLGL